MMADLARIKRNVRKMVDMGAPEADIDQYIAEEGTSVDALRAFRETGGGGHQNVPEFRPVGVEGYDPATGEVSGRRQPSLVDKVVDAHGASYLGAIDSIPVAGPALSAATKATAAGLVSPFSEKDFGEVYDDMDRSSRGIRAENPVATTIGNVGGAVAGTLPMIAAAPAAFGIGQATRLGQMVASGVGGAGLNAADAAVRSGGDLEEVGRGALQGGATGFLSPVVAALLGKGAGAIYDKVKNSRAAKQLGIDPRAWALFSDAAKRDGLGDDALARLGDLGDAGMAMDLGPNLQNQAGALAAMPGRAQSIVKEAVEGRDKAANMRIRGDVDAAIGPAPVPSQIIEGIEANQSALSPEYTAVLQNGRPVDASGIAKYLDREVQNLRGDAQKAMRSVRTMLNKVGSDELETNPAVLFEARKAVDGMLETVQESNARNALTTARQAIDDQLRASVPGLKTVDGKYAELARQKEAVKRGQQTLSSGREAPRPSELADEVQQGALPQGEMVGPSAVPMRLSQGARAEIERIIGTTANDRVALQRLVKGEGDWNRDRLATMFGKDKADDIIRIVDRERQFADTSHVTNRNSLTAARQQAIADVGGYDADSGLSMVDAYKAGGTPAIARSAGVDAAKKMLQALQAGGKEKVLENLATTLSSKDRAVFEALSMMTPMPMSQVNRVARALMLAGPGGVGR